MSCPQHVFIFMLSFSFDILMIIRRFRTQEIMWFVLDFWFIYLNCCRWIFK